jgi:hypothetical protein
MASVICRMAPPPRTVGPVLYQTSPRNRDRWQFLSQQSSDLPGPAHQGFCSDPAWPAQLLRGVPGWRRGKRQHRDFMFVQSYAWWISGLRGILVGAV